MNIDSVSKKTIISAKHHSDFDIKKISGNFTKKVNEYFGKYVWFIVVHQNEIRYRNVFIKGTCIFQMYLCMNICPLHVMMFFNAKIFKKTCFSWKRIINCFTFMQSNSSVLSTMYFDSKEWFGQYASNVSFCNSIRLFLLSSFHSTQKRIKFNKPDIFNLHYLRILHFSRKKAICST